MSLHDSISSTGLSPVVRILHSGHNVATTSIEGHLYKATAPEVVVAARTWSWGTEMLIGVPVATAAICLDGVCTCLSMEWDAPCATVLLARL